MNGRGKDKGHKQELHDVHKQQGITKGYETKAINGDAATKKLKTSKSYLDKNYATKSTHLSLRMQALIIGILTLFKSDSTLWPINN